MPLKKCLWFYFISTLDTDLKEAMLVLSTSSSEYKTSYLRKSFRKILIWIWIGLVVFVLIGWDLYVIIYARHVSNSWGGILPSQTMNVLENMLQNRKYDSEKKVTESSQIFWKESSIRE